MSLCDNPEEELELVFDAIGGDVEVGDEVAVDAGPEKVATMAEERLMPVDEAYVVEPCTCTELPEEAAADAVASAVNASPVQLKPMALTGKSCENAKQIPPTP